MSHHDRNVPARPQVAIVRGHHLNPFEMQTYALLCNEFDLTAIAAQENRFETDPIGFPIVHLHQPREIGLDIPHWRGFCNLATRRLFGSEERLLGLGRLLPRFDIVHTVETFNYYSLQAVRAKSKTGRPVVLTVWENIPFNLEHFPHFAQCKREVRQNADMFLAITEQARSALIREGVPENRIHVIGAGIDVQCFRPGKADAKWYTNFDITTREKIVLFVGRLSKSKGVYDLLTAVHLLSERGVVKSNTHKVLVIGQGAEELGLRTMTQSLGIDDIVRFGGGISYTDMPDIHRLADVFVLPSVATPTWEEQFGMVLAESMASGKAVIGTISGAIPEVVGEAGILVPPESPDSLAQALHNLLADDSQRSEFGRKARQRIESTFAHSLVAERIACVYRTLLQDKCGG